MLADSMFDDFFRSSSSFHSLPAFYAIFTVIPIIIAISSGPMVAMASQDFTVYRMQHYDLAGSSHGSRNSIMNLEARTIHQFSESFARKCVIVKFKDLMGKMHSFEDLISQTVAGGVLILLPNFDSLTQEEVEEFIEMEKLMLSDSIRIPVYFAEESDKLLEIYDEIDSSYLNLDTKNVSVIQKLISAVTANGYQLVVTTTSQPIKEPVIANIEAKLAGNGNEDQLPSITIVAHYDAFGVTPGLAFGADSNGSGVIAIIELIRLFSKLYSNPKTHPKANLIFVLTGGGKISYFGSRKWIEENLDNSESSLLSETLFTMCLDSLSNENLYMHVSKPPKENTPSAIFFNDLKQTALNIGSGLVNVSLTHKKINLADETLAWEHERFSIRRLPAFTISSVNAPKNYRRWSIVDRPKQVDVDLLSRNIQIIAESLAKQLFRFSDQDNLEVFYTDLKVSKTLVSTFLYLLTNKPRGQQLLLTTSKGTTYQHPALISTFEHILKKYAKEVEIYNIKPDKREPEFIFYDPAITMMTIYNVKPAIFDLFLSVSIVLYLGVLFLFLTYFQQIQMVAKLIKGGKINTQNGYAPLKGKQQ